MDEVTLQPAAGAHGEWTALMIFKRSFDLTVTALKPANDADAGFVP
jgi:glycine cleavage system protein P-like pyridoxal-binding family